MQPVEPIFIAQLFPELHTHLIHLLRDLAGVDWTKPTACSPWTVKDVAAHLLDGNVRQLSFRRDNLAPLDPGRPITSLADLTDFLNQVNHEWIQASQRISPQLMIELLDLTGRQVSQFFQTLDPFEPALFSVAWAGDESSPNWFDLAREYTERWLHQQHIREAVGRPGLVSRRYLYPVLDTFMRALPFTYRAVEAKDGDSLWVTITGEAGGDWSLVREAGTWGLFNGRDTNARAHASLDQDTAWRLFTKGLNAADARAQLKIDGEETLGLGLLKMVSIMA